MSDVAKKIVKGLKEAASGKSLMVTVYCPKCRTPQRTEMPMLRLFGTQHCKGCGHHWIPPRAKRAEA